MRINKFVASATGMSRRAADAAIEAGLVSVNNTIAQPGQQVSLKDAVSYDKQLLAFAAKYKTALLDKPVGYVCSRDGQGSKTVYDLLPMELHDLKPVGRLDKNSSGLLLLTNDGQLAHELTHPKFAKTKVYQVELDKPLPKESAQQISEKGVLLNDGISNFELKGSEKNWQVTMSEGRNRQIRRTFAALGYEVTKLHRTQFGEYKLYQLNGQQFIQL